MRRGVVVLLVLAVVAALAARTTAHDDGPGVEHVVDLDWPTSNVYFVYTGVQWHHNPWRCIHAFCQWAQYENDLDTWIFSPFRQPAEGLPSGWLDDTIQEQCFTNHDPGRNVSECQPSQVGFVYDYVVATKCRLADTPRTDLGCSHTASGYGWRWVGSSAYGDAYTKGLHDDHDWAIVAAVCLSDSQLAEAKADADFRVMDVDDLRGWRTSRRTVSEALGRGWTAQGEAPRIALYNERLMGGTARFIWDDGHNLGPWLIEPAAFWLDTPLRQSPSSEFSLPMSAEELGSCWSDPVVVDDSVPWMAATVCQRASDFNLRVGNTDSYPWVDATGKPWYRALDHRSTAEATRLYRPLDWALLGFEEWQPLADAAVAAGLVWAVWPDDPDDPAYDSTGRSYADYGGKPVCILANG